MVIRFILLFSIVVGTGCGPLQLKSANRTQAMQTSSTEQKASVIHESDARHAAPPSKKAKIVHLAEGANAYLGKLWLAPGGKVPLHRDSSEEYLYVVSGGGELTMDGQKYVLKAGHAVYMPAGAEVTFQNGAEPLVVLQVFAGPDSAKKYRKWVPAEAVPVQPPAKQPVPVEASTKQPAPAQPPTDQAAPTAP